MNDLIKRTTSLALQSGEEGRTTFVFPTLFVANSYMAYLFLCLVSIIGAALTFTIIPETKGLGLEESQQGYRKPTKNTFMVI